MATCDHCGEDDHLDRARFCHNCSMPLASNREARRRVTIVFTDVKDSMKLSERVEEEQLRRVIGRFYGMAREVLERYGGTLQKFMGDAVVAVFGAPKQNEDDPFRAVRAANDLRPALARLNEELEREYELRLGLHTGVNTGEAVFGNPVGGVSILLGDAINVAARLSQAAGEGEILIANSTYQRVRDAVKVDTESRSLELKGKDGTMSAWRLRDVFQRTRRAFSNAPMVGREHDIDVLKAQLQRTATERRCHLVVVSGDSGVGKSRLVHEFCERVRKTATVLRGSCSPYGDSTSPLKELLLQAVGAARRDYPLERALERLSELVEGDQRVIARVAPILSGDETFAEDEDTFRALRRTFYLLAEQRPLVIFIDDLQWARPDLLDFIEQAAMSPRPTRVLLVCVARSEFFHSPERINWGRNLLNSSFMHLTQLSDEQTKELIRHLLKEGEVPEDVQAVLQEKAEGVPFFLEEFIAMLAEDGALQLVDGHWELSGERAEMGMPATIEEILASRLDRLGPDETSVVEPAAVIGTQFATKHIAALTSDMGHEAITATLQDLVRKELLLVDQGEYDEGGDTFTFRHALTQETAYRRIPKEDLARLHEVFADWLERNVNGRAPPDEVIGLHLEKAYQYHLQLHHMKTAKDLARRAGERLAAAGHRGVSNAVVLLRRALELLPEDHPGRLDAMLDLADALRQSNLELAKDTYDRVVEIAARAEDRRASMHAVLAKLEVIWFHNFRGDWEKSRAEVDRALRVFDELDDDLGRAKARRLLAYMHAATGHSTDAREEAELAIRLVGRAQDDRLEAQIRRLYGVILFWGPTPLDEVIAKNEDAVQWAKQKGAYSLEAGSLSLLARAAAMRRDFAEARRLNELAGRLVPDLVELLTVAADSISEGLVELLAGDLPAAERALSRGFRALERRGANPSQANIAAMLARVLFLQRRYDEALKYTEACENLSAKGQLDTRIKWRAVRALVLARQGKHGEAEALGRAAVDLTARSEQLDSKAEALTDLAEVLVQTGDPRKRTEAAGLLRNAVALYKAKGNVVSSDRPAALLADLERTGS
jgi:class 3 adenylate cyclase/tetratricopeptide (TPR) repeat protein